MSAGRAAKGMRPAATRILGKGAAYIAAIGWGVSVVGLIVPSATAFVLLNDFGGNDLVYDAMLDYWLRMASAAFVFIGAQFLYCGLTWGRHPGLQGILGAFQLLMGMTLWIAWARIRPDLGNAPYDIGFCLTTGAVMLLATVLARTSGPRRSD